MIRGSLTALVTPFTADAVDEAALRALVDWQITEGSHGLVPVGTTGESPTLTPEEHERVIDLVVAQSAGRVPVIAGTGSNNTEEAIRFTAHAKAAGADAALVVTPYYNKPTQAGLIAHYRTLHDAVEIPIIIYNIPGRSVVDMSPETMGELSKLPRIIGVKDATSDVVRASHQRALCGHDFIQLSGEDASALGFNAHGGTGSISVTANVAPALCSEFQESMMARDWARALELHDKLMPLHTALFLEPGLVGAKYALSLLGRCAPTVRLPLVEPSAPTQAAIHAAMVRLGLLRA
ncbi:MAG: 4-hydroxy-tetrahydrodipicolinate synthase [Pikeienuella sp.]